MFHTILYCLTELISHYINDVSKNDIHKKLDWLVIECQIKGTYMGMF